MISQLLVLTPSEFSWKDFSRLCFPDTATIVYKMWSHRNRYCTIFNNTAATKLSFTFHWPISPLEHWTCDQQVMCSNPTRGKSCITNFVQVSCSHLCASVTKQYKLVPAKRRGPVAGKVTAGLAESNGSLLQGGSSPAGWLPVHRISSRPNVRNEYGKPFLYH